jgi:hypothetical protein
LVASVRVLPLMAEVEEAKEIVVEEIEAVEAKMP